MYAVSVLWQNDCHSQKPWFCAHSLLSVTLSHTTSGFQQSRFSHDIRLLAVTLSHTTLCFQQLRLHTRNHAFSPPSIFRTRASCCGPVHAASKQRRNICEYFKDLNQETKARIWPRLSYMCHIRSTSERTTYSTRRLRAAMATTKEKIVVFKTPGLRCRSLDSGELRCKSRELEKTIWSDSAGW